MENIFITIFIPKDTKIVYNNQRYCHDIQL